MLNSWLGDGVDDGSAPIDNHRPTSCKFDDTGREEAPDATNAKMGRMFANLVNYQTGDLPTWRDHGGSSGT